MNAQQLREQLIAIHNKNTDNMELCAEFEEVVINMTDDQVFDMASEMGIVCVQ